MITKENNYNKKKYRVCIPTAGIGSRLKSLTKNLNKSLVDINHKAIISHIIEKFPHNTEFVIPLGFKGDLVKQYLRLTYPKRKIFFTNVKKYKGKGSGLGLSILSAKKYLNQPFIFISCDTLINDRIPKLDKNWVGFSDYGDPKKYRGIKLYKGLVENFLDKNFEKRRENKVYIGMAGINDYTTFWKEMDNNRNYSIPVGEVYGLKNISKKIYAYRFKWSDVGNVKDYEKIKKKQKSNKNILEKNNEKIWFANKRVIKFFENEKIISKRVSRTKILKKYVPRIINYKKNMYAYREIKGETFSNINDINAFKRLLAHIGKFHKVKKNINSANLKKICNKFYKDKTISRIKDFHKKFKIKDNNIPLNGTKTYTIKEILNKVDWKNLSNGTFANFHGDLHFENIIYSQLNKKFTFLDWRQDFGGNLRYGDIYYDLAKLMHGLIVSHKFVQNNQFKIKWTKKNIKFSIKSVKIYKKYLSIYKKWIFKNKYDYKKINILTAIIYLNIASLHHYPYSLFLYALGKKILTDILIYNKDDIILNK